MHPTETARKPSEATPQLPESAAAEVSPTATRASAETPRIVVAIPARHASTRLPGKPLRTLLGRPMIQWVVERVQAADGVARAVVLTDDERIADAVTAFGAEAEMTPQDCPSGTDRIAWAVERWAEQADDETAPAAFTPTAVVNVQGDEPLLDPDVITRVARHLADHPEDEMVTLSAPLAAQDIDDPAKVKVVTDRSGYALYFSRAAIPHARDGRDSETQGATGIPVAPRLHVGLYGYQTTALARLAALPPSPLEQTEALEQLRALENGIRIRVLPCDHAAFGVDTEADLRRAEELLRRDVTPSARPPTESPEAASEPPSA